ncbi:uncharacterized protein DS421_13g429430 [Arachis hypogaea]|nr:uncharacterized protein DS421_13g429430 [Arachis hypogaea]
MRAFSHPIPASTTNHRLTLLILPPLSLNVHSHPIPASTTNHRPTLLIIVHPSPLATSRTSASPGAPRQLLLVTITIGLKPEPTASETLVSDHPSFSPSLSRSCRPEDLRTHSAPTSLPLATLEPQYPLLLFSPPTTLTYRGYLLLITEPVPLTGHRTSRRHRSPLCEPNHGEGYGDERVAMRWFVAKVVCGKEIEVRSESVHGWRLVLLRQTSYEAVRQWGQATRRRERESISSISGVVCIVVGARRLESLLWQADDQQRLCGRCNDVIEAEENDSRINDVSESRRII